MSQRGGAVFSHVRFGDKVYSPVIAKGKVDVLLSLEEMETLRWTEFLNKDSRLIVLNNRILPANTAEYPQGLTEKIKSQFNNVISIDPDEYTKKLGNAKYLNVFLLGVLSNYVKLPEESWKDAIQSLVPNGTFDKNYEAFLIGKDYK
jgi:indolepyruvate ferredoxin oxidoreductase beta subunit